MPETITTREVKEVESELTPGFCFQKAAEALLGGQNLMGANAEAARMWKELGETIHYTQEHPIKGAKSK